MNNIGLYGMRTSRKIILKKLGEGASGSVYLVSIPLKGLFAVKSSAIAVSSSLLKEDRILREFVGCDEIVQYFGTEINFGYRNLFLEFAEGGSLGNYIFDRKDVRLHECIIKDFTRMLLRGLSTIHKKGIVHADFKPDNILMFPTSDFYHPFQLKISDFGLSKIIGEETQCCGRRGFYGTAEYMSPESVANGEIKPPLDIWSLGCTVIEMFTGKPAWKYHWIDLDFLAYRLIDMEKSPEIPENIPEDAKDFLSKCFVRDPKLRWTADMLLDHQFVAEDYATRLYDQQLDRVIEQHLASSCKNLSNKSSFTCDEYFMLQQGIQNLKVV